MKKRIISLISAICMTAILLPSTAFAFDAQDAVHLISENKSKIYVDNDTTEESLKASFEKLLPEDSGVELTIIGFDKQNATTEDRGSIGVKIHCVSGTYSLDEYMILYIPVAEQNDNETKLIEEDAEAVKAAFDEYIASVTVTSDNILTHKKALLKAAEEAVKNGSEVNWLTDPLFSTAMPKNGNNGHIRGFLSLVLGAETRAVELNAVVYEDGSAAMKSKENNNETAKPTAEPTVEPTQEPAPTDAPEITPAPVTAPSIPAIGTAHPSTQVVEIDGNKVTFEMYALLNEDGNPTNYIKVRDLALALNGTAAQFEVDWNGAVNLVSGTPYTANGSENNTPFSDEREYTLPANPTNVNGEASDLTAIFLTDDNGGGYTYYQLRDLGKKLGFNVGWDSERGIFAETDKAYQE